MTTKRWTTLAVLAASCLGSACAAGSQYGSAAGTTSAEAYYPASGEIAGGGDIYPGMDRSGYVGDEESYAASVDVGEPPPSAAAGRGGGSRPVQVAANAAQPQSQGPAPTVAVDAPAQRELIIYTADITLALYEVDATQRALAAAIAEIGGFVATLDANTLVVRVPAAQFESFLARVEGSGQVLGRRIQAEDVTEQFRDLQIRLENLNAMRERLEAMLARATNVQEAIQVERELERVTVELESLRGRLRFLADRVAFSTITIRFRPLPREQLAGNVPTRLPIAWLETLGLSTLMR